MSEQPHQNFKNHARFHPIFHFFFVPAVAFLLVSAIIHAVRYPSFDSVCNVLLVFLVGSGALIGRTYALKVQDRVIRLEERMRLAAVLPSHLRPTAYTLSESQLIALRFASDEEVAALAERARTENLNSKQIKSSINKWRPDYWRV